MKKRNDQWSKILLDLSEKEIKRKSKFGRRMTESQKNKMREMFTEGYALGHIARKFACCVNTVWNNVFYLDKVSSDSEKVNCYTLSKKKIDCAIKCSKLTAKQILAIRSLSHKDRDKYNAIALSKIYCVNQSTILGIVRGRTFRWVGGWTQPLRTEPAVYLTPTVEVRLEGKTDAVFGPRKGSKMFYHGGELKRLAEKEGVDPTTMCRRMKKLRMNKSLEV
jgi:predicted DNA-binding protein YlxM (UPF0122 family)